MKTILCPTDFSENSENALYYASDLARINNSKIILIFVYETPVVYTDVSVSVVAIDFEALHESALSQLNHFYSKVREKVKDIKFELIIQQGLPSSRITETALEKNADLIVMATTSSTAIERLLMGSNANRVFRDAQCPVLLIPPDTKFKPVKKIVYTTDLSDDNLKAASAVVDFAKLFDAELVFLNIDNKLLSHDQKDLTKVTEKIKQFIDYPKMEGYIGTDVNVAEGVTHFLEKYNADCLAVATHHYDFLRGITHSSVTKKMAYHTHIPLLVTHLPEGV